MSAQQSAANSFQAPSLLPYVADLELEVDRLRKQIHFVRQEAREALRRIRDLCVSQRSNSATLVGQTADTPAPWSEVERNVKELAGLLRDLQEPTGYHPAHDEVIAIAVRPLAQQVFRWQQRLLGATNVVLRLELASEHMEWFPARLRHILDNLLSNALRYRDSSKAESWVELALRTAPTAYELRVSDNGVGLSARERADILELFYRAAPARAAGLGVGLAVVKLLVEQSQGTLQVDSGTGQGATFVATLPRYDLEDYLTS